MATTDAKWTVIFGDPSAGSIRVRYGGQEIPNVLAAEVKSKQGELPELELKVMAPQIEVEDRTSSEVTSTKEEVVTTKQLPKAAEKAAKASAVKPA